MLLCSMLKVNNCFCIIKQRRSELQANIDFAQLVFVIANELINVPHSKKNAE